MSICPVTSGLRPSSRSVHPTIHHNQEGNNKITFTYLFLAPVLPLSNVDSIFSPCLHNQTSMLLQRENPHCYTPPPLSLAGRQRWIDDSKERDLLEQWRRPDRLLASLVSLQLSCFNLLFRILSPVLRPKVDKQNQPTSKPKKNPQTRSVRASVISAFPGDNASWVSRVRDINFL